MMNYIIFCAMAALITGMIAMFNDKKISSSHFMLWLISPFVLVVCLFMQQRKKFLTDFLDELFGLKK